MRHRGKASPAWRKIQRPMEEWPTPYRGVSNAL